MLNDTEYLNQGRQFNKKQNQQTLIEGFATNIMQEKQTRDLQNAYMNSTETDTLNNLDGQYNVLTGQYTQANANLLAKTDKILTRISSSNPYLNKNITLGADAAALPISDTGNFGGYVTGKGVFKSYSSQDIKDNTAGKNGCPASFTQLQKNKFSDSLIQGSNMQSGQACGYEGQNVYVSGLNSNPTTTYVGCYRDNNKTNAYTAMTYDSNAIGITDFNTCKQYASENGYSYFGMQNLQSSGLAQCVVSNNSIDTIKNNGDANKIISLKPIWSSKTNSSVSNSMKLNDMGQLEIFNTITENIVFSTKNIVPECVNSGKIEVTSASYDINCNKIISGFTNLFSAIEGFAGLPNRPAAPKPPTAPAPISTVAPAPVARASPFSPAGAHVSTVAPVARAPVSTVAPAPAPVSPVARASPFSPAPVSTVAPAPVARASPFSPAPRGAPFSTSAAIANAALSAAIAKAAADKAAAEKAAAEKAAIAKASAEKAAVAKTAVATAEQSRSMASFTHNSMFGLAARIAAIRAAEAKAEAERAAAARAASAKAAADKAAAEKAAADRAAAEKTAADKARAEKAAADRAAEAKAAADRAAAAAAAAAKAEAERKARATEAIQKVSKECNNKKDCSISANSLFNTDKACNFNVAYKCGTRPFTNSAPLNGSQNMILNCDNYITNNCMFYLLLQDDGSINIYKGKGPSESESLGTPVYNVFTNTSQLIPNPEWTTHAGKGRGNYIRMNKGLTPGQWLTSKSGTVKLIMQTDGNLVLYTSVITIGCPKINDTNYGIKNINAVYQINENIKNLNKSNLGKVAYIDADTNLREYPETMLQKSNKYNIYNKYDSIGNNINNGIIAANNVDDCKTSCNANNECAGFVYKPSEQKCYLKDVKMYPAGERQRVDNSNFVMGVRIPEIIPNVVKTCDKTIVPIDSIRYNAYKKGDIMNENVDCGITQELTQEQSIFDTVKTSLSNLKNKIIGKSNNAEVSYTEKITQIIPKNTVSATTNENDNSITKAEIDLTKVNDYKITEGFDTINMDDINSMLSDSDITILQSNYSYIMWSALAVGLLSVTVNTVK